MDAGTYETAYTQEVIAMLQTYLQEMEGNSIARLAPVGPML